MLNRISTTLPVHPRSGLRAVGIVAGRPVWPIRGAADPGDPDPDPGELEDAAGGAGGAGGADPLGDKGKQAIDRMKAERNEARKALTAYKDLGLDPDKLRELIGKSEADQQAAEQQRVRREADAAAIGKANERLVKAEVRAAAAGKLANPAIALKLLDLSAFDVDDDGEVDTAAIEAAISDLVKNEPYLGVTQGDATRFGGTADTGPKGTAGKPQLTEAQVKQLSRDGKHAEIEKARTEGRLNTLLGIT